MAQDLLHELVMSCMQATPLRSSDHTCTQADMPDTARRDLCVQLSKALDDATAMVYRPTPRKNGGRGIFYISCAALLGAFLATVQVGAGGVWLIVLHVIWLRAVSVRSSPGLMLVL